MGCEVREVREREKSWCHMAHYGTQVPLWALFDVWTLCDRLHTSPLVCVCVLKRLWPLQCTSTRVNKPSSGRGATHVKGNAVTNGRVCPVLPASRFASPSPFDVIDARCFHRRRSSADRRVWPKIKLKRVGPGESPHQRGERKSRSVCGSGGDFDDAPQTWKCRKRLEHCLCQPWQIHITLASG